MIYCGTINEERIAVHPMGDVNNTQFIELTKYGDEPVFSVDLSDGDDIWLWKFDMSNPSDYERVKLCIFNAVCECNTMDELACILDAIFREAFDDILFEDVCEDCYEDECEYCSEYGSEYCGYVQ